MRSDRTIYALATCAALGMACVCIIECRNQLTRHDPDALAMLLLTPIMAMFGWTLVVAGGRIGKYLFAVFKADGSPSRRRAFLIQVTTFAALSIIILEAGWVLAIAPDRRFERDAQAVTGTVLRSHTRNHDLDLVQYHVDGVGYTLYGITGQRVDNEDRRAAGSQVTVWVDPRDPSNASLGLGGSMLSTWTTIAIAFVVPTLVVGLNVIRAQQKP